MAERAERKDAVAEALETLRAKQRDLEFELKKVKDAIVALQAATRASEAGAPVKRPVDRHYEYRFTVTCTRCGKEYQAARSTTRSPLGWRFCNQPCTSAMFRDEQIAKGQTKQPIAPIPPALTPPREKGTVLVQGARRG